MELKGEVIYPGVVEGEPVLVNELFERITKDQVKGKIMVIKRLSMESAYLIGESKGVIMIGGSLLSHVAIVSREFRKPAVRLPENTEISSIIKAKSVKIERDKVIIQD